MLCSLYIENYVLIERLSIDFGQGFSVITGETGAGKSIILGALGLILGQRTDSKAIREGASKCVIEGTFTIVSYDLQPFFATNELEYADETIIRREIYASGKSRAFINDSPVGLLQLKELGEKLIDIHSQHQNLLLQHSAFQLNVVDIVANTRLLLKEYQNAFASYQIKQKQLVDLRSLSLQKQAERDYLLFQWQQLLDAKLVDDEQEMLEEELNILQHAGEIKDYLQKTLHIIDGHDNAVLSSLKEAMGMMRHAQQLFPAMEEYERRIDSIQIELKDITGELGKHEMSIDVEPDRLLQVQQRLDELYSLEQKHRVTTLSALIDLRDKFATELKHIEEFDEDILTLEKETAHLLQEVVVLGEQLSVEREKSFSVIVQHVEKQLRQLGMKHVVFQVERKQLTDWTLIGHDEIQFLFSSNMQVKPQPVAQIASGGEISRVMLSLKSLIANTKSLPTIIFDEIDMGISGEIANAMSLIMKQLGGVMQVIAITHLPQIAAKGMFHYRVSKTIHNAISETTIQKLSETERVAEIATMLSGASVTQAAIDNAKQLLAGA
ncbi:DNA repair protein RecN [Microbacter margulisiae]|uniref:DNA repair protein RecN n=1 Tax=Microbacter margulisiae TaxID=1350067 RepID=A0A7W5DPG8_9PORP|nr:DNA repair protein RecN [Microbacter margulisiae]MBB3186687.1 DNA repair protein RecN (Recombination protein N) [Microbacter margulisiae]